MRVNEYNIIGSAVRLNEIPPEFRKLRLLGRGATTIAFQKDPDTAIVITRDNMKKDYLMHGLHMVTKSQIIEPIRSHHIRGMQDVSLWAIEMPMLYPLSTENSRKVSKEIKDWTKISADARAAAMNRGFKIDKSKFFNYVQNKYETEHPDSVLAPLFDFLANYDPSQYGFDIGKRQFKQTNDGKIILLDPIVDQELLDLFQNHRKNKGNLYYNNG